MLYKNRYKFRKNLQNHFIAKCQKKLNFNNQRTANLLSVSVRTITDWKREKFLLPINAARILSKKSGIPIPKTKTSKKQFWYVTKGARLGGLRSYKKQGNKIGDPAKQKEKWREWWETIGKHQKQKIFKPLPWKKPPLSGNLAELLGIIMGDGGITRYQVTVSLHHKNDLAYSKFVIALMKNLFEIRPSIYHYPKKSIYNIVISRSELIEYLRLLGLPIGNKIKQQFDIPQWIKEKKNFRIACVRGLFDTDGSVFTHRYKVRGKYYAYKKLCFTSASAPLTNSVLQILKYDVRITPRLTKNGRDVRIDNISDVKQYFSMVGSHNPKHLKRYSA